MSETNIDCDVVVVGGGMAGMVTAVRAAELGLRVQVLERSAEDRYLCNTRISGGIIHCAQTDIQSDPALLARKIMDVTSGTADAALATAVAGDGLRGARWLQQHGVKFIKGAEPYYSFIMAPPVILANTREWRGRGGDLMLRTLEAVLVRNGGCVKRGHRASRLMLSAQGQCQGIAGTHGTGEFALRARHVVIADGGFQSDTARLKGPVSPAPDRIFQRNARSGLGDGLRMAIEAGASITDLHGFYGHVLSRDAFRNDNLWPYRWLDFVAAAGVVVDADGRRFCDEGLGGVHIANSIAALEDPLSVTVIADSAIWNTRGRHSLLPPNPMLKELGGTVHEDASLAALASRAGLPPQGLEETIRLYNDAVRDKALAGLVPGRSTHKFDPHPVARAPFYAFPVCAGITYTMGGIRIDANARVLTASGAPIPGLFAAGATTGGLEGGPLHGYVGGLVKSLVTGLRAAETMARA